MAKVRMGSMMLDDRANTLTKLGIDRVALGLAFILSCQVWKEVSRNVRPSVGARDCL